MTREHVVPHGSIPLFARPRGAPPPPTRRPEGPSAPLGAPPPDRDLLLGVLRPVLAELSVDAVAFGRTAAYLWGVDVHPRGIRATRTRLHVAVPPGVEKVSRHAVVPHRELLPPSDRTLVAGVRVTTPARTALDVAHGAESLYGATAALDRFLALGLVDPQGLSEALSRHPRGARPRMRRAVDLSDPGSHSPAESWTRVMVCGARLPRPRTQCPVETVQGLFHADLGWPDHRVAVEYDSAAHHCARHERARDRLRHRAMADAGWLVVSIGVHDLQRRPARLLRRLRDALFERGWDPPRAERERIRWAIRRLESRPPRLVREMGT